MSWLAERRERRDMLSRIPEAGGLPILGQTLNFFFRPISSGIDMHLRHGPVVRGKVRGKDALEAWHNNEAEATVIFKRKPPSSPDSVMELPSVSIKEFSLEPSLIKRETVDQGDADDATHSTRRDRPHAQIHSRATKCAKAKAQGLMEKRWVRGRAARRAAAPRAPPPPARPTAPAAGR